MNTVDQQTALEQVARQRIKEALALEGDADRLTHFYRGWAGAYDVDVGCEGYCGPMIVAELAGAVQAAYLSSERTAIAMLDAGCGTGLVGVQLERLGFRLIDGFDLSKEMAEKARQTRVYRHVRDGVDLNGVLSGYADAGYDITVCCGVFTLGHVRPDGLRELARVTRPKGFIVTSIRNSYAEAAFFDDHVRRLQEEGVLLLAQRLSNGRYVAQERADYWVFQVLEKVGAAERQGL
ncbi:methyltransferase domain-containing protein [Mesorhizobium japonicum]|uniref:class I SAM-dependent DNA methyltransferase n=1 Tax=Mesorhizobium TaxID=68287 RepID=UPI00080049AF|nr:MULTISPECIES: class I SAM-dependent methyltransferase [Mesorhizobium]MUT24763.1 methyltransferase domain-containing protein [Mesorhizobium japonicum]OBQ95820.1 methyltransferase type 11 [Mesorhizobium sp. AA23]